MKPFECGECGVEIDPDHDSSYWHGDMGCDLCPECYAENVHHCPMCGDDDVMPSQQSEFILATAELSMGGLRKRPSGIFRVMNRPFLSVPLIGSCSMDADQLVWVDRLPKRSSAYEYCGFLCRACAVPYEKIWRRVYQFAPLQSRWGEKRRQRVRVAGQRHYAGYKSSLWVHRLWRVEMAHTRKMLKRHPQILRDIESPLVINPETGYRHSGLNELQRTYRFTIRQRTWHEWLLLDYKGVKIYGCYSSRDDLSSWLLLTGDPLHRCLRGRARNPELVLVAWCLPTYDRGEEDGYDSKYTKQVKSRAAILAAIDEGLLRQDGAYDREGKRLICG